MSLDVNVTGTLLAILDLPSRFRGDERLDRHPLRRRRDRTVRRAYDAYAASKAAVVRLTENLAVDLGADRRTCQQRGPRLRADRRCTTRPSPPDRSSSVASTSNGPRAPKRGRGDSPELAARLVSFLVSESVDRDHRQAVERPMGSRGEEPGVPREAPPGQGPGDASSDR